MSADSLRRHLARVTIETRAPLSLGAGRGDGVFDVSVARDANNLPYLPATSLAGVLRALWRDHYGHDPVEIFGAADNRASRLAISSGHIHDGNDVPVDGLVHERARLSGDPLLGPLLTDDLPHRDHVALDRRGSARAHSKFDRTFVPVGHRFTFDLAFESGCGDAADADWRRLLALLGSPAFRLGGATRNAYGAFRVHHVRAGEFDLRTQAGRAAYAATPARLDQPANALLPVDLPALAAGSGWQAIVLALQPEDFWRAGNGGHAFSRRDKLADALPYSERRVEWNGGRGSLAAEPHIVLPGSAIKGALAHRLAYHHRRLAGSFVDPAAPPDDTPDQAAKALFGYVDECGDGRAGRVLIDDLRLSAAAARIAVIQHNSLDRFTGGVRRGILFSEEVVGGAPFKLRLHVRDDALGELAEDERQRVRRALRATLLDLCRGRLALGAAQAKGHGYFSGVIEKAPDWLMEEGK